MVSKNRRGQIAIFVIVALLIIAGVGIYLVTKQQTGTGNIPTSLVPVYEYYDQCIEQETRNAIDLAGSQGGRIDAGEYIPGSDFMPFSSQLNFLGFPVSYWYYVSGNGVIKEQAPSEKDLESELNNYLENRIGNCDFTSFIDRGYSVSFDEPIVNVDITESKVSVQTNGKLIVGKDGESAEVSSRKVEFNSKFGKLFRIAREIYEKEKGSAFLENYTLDVLSLYAPVDGVVIQCSPKVWKEQEVVNDLQNALEANIAALRFRGSGEEKTKEQKYFTIDYAVDSDVGASVMYSSKWPWKVEIYGSDSGLMMAEPVGNQQGMGLMGFCYAPYHFVYDLAFPVMFQISSGQEIFQFPVSVVIDKNYPRQALFADVPTEDIDVDICNVKNTEAQINVYDINLNKIDANLRFRCFNQVCPLGKTENGGWSGLVPACVNGYVEARAVGYTTKQTLYSSNSESSVDIVMDKEFNVSVSVKMNGKEVDKAFVVMTGERDASVALPEMRNTVLSEGNYNITVYIYGNSSLTFPASSRQECRTVPDSGFLGFFGGTSEQCFSVDLPATKIEYALLGGGSTQTYITPGNLESGKITFDVEALRKPDTLEKLQENYASFPTLKAEVSYE